MNTCACTDRVFERRRSSRAVRPAPPRSRPAAAPRSCRGRPRCPRATSAVRSPVASDPRTKLSSRPAGPARMAGPSSVAGSRVSMEAPVPGGCVSPLARMTHHSDTAYRQPRPPQSHAFAARVARASRVDRRPARREGRRARRLRGCVCLHSTSFWMSLNESQPPQSVHLPDRPRRSPRPAAHPRSSPACARPSRSSSSRTRAASNASGSSSSSATLCRAARPTHRRRRRRCTTCCASRQRGSSRLRRRTRTARCVALPLVE